MSIARLRAFHAVALEGTIQGGANRLHISQPAVSQHLRQIEEMTDKPIFRRSGHRLELSPDGQVLFDAVDRMLRAEHDAQRALRGPDGGMGGTLVVGSDGPFNVLDLVSELRRRNPGILVEVKLGNAAKIWADLLDLRIDVAVIADSPEDARTYREELARLSLVALVPSAHPLASARALALEDLAGEPLIFRETGSSTQRLLGEALAGRGLDIAPTMVLGSRESVCAAVVRGLGIGFAFDCELNEDPRALGIPIAGFEEISTDHVVSMKAQQGNRLVRAVFACIGDVAQQRRR
ncbi:LysR substrate-binding domain-containing protein [Paralimibaculum aggregatum]|uniref:LysR substrate-binding domain-containing protein n=1 Tax=Paralimibaculum aggregatum TaxID=3036245 RepID=A0ABQ6LPX0_9RHOB|nr:LysR substrate-binding domain-containing protein [Limibaculum sp. NKW23]GMG84485.1 LysR substrate-binding domain-containing protein [Limibaculum sp. NKW23]